MGFTVRQGLHIEHIDSEVLVLRPGSDRVLHLRDAQAAAFTLAQHGTGDVPDDLVVAMAGLVELGLVETDAWSRRRVLQLGGAAAAGAVAVVALPSIAAAASPPETDPSTTTSSTSTTTTAPPQRQPGLYISSYQSYNVVKWPGSGTSVSVGVPRDPTPPQGPAGLAVGPDGRLYIANTFGSTVSKWTPTSGATATDFITGQSSPTGLAVDSAGNLYIADQGTSTVKKWDFATSTLSTVVTGVSYPQALYMDSSDHLYIATYDNKVKFWNGGSLTTVAFSDLSLPAGLAWF